MTQKPKGPQSGPAPEEAPVSPAEAVAKAFEELGRIAPRARVQAFVRERFGLDVTAAQVAAARGETRGRPAVEESPAAEPEAEEAEEDALPPREEPKRPRVTRTEAVRRALAELGRDASRTAIQTHAREHSGHDIPLHRVSNIKSELGRSPESRVKAAPPAKARPGRPPAPKRPAAPPAEGGSVRIEDIMKLRELIDRVGPEEVRALVEILGA